MRTTLVKTPSNGGYGALTSHILLPSKTSSGDVWTTTQPQDPQSTVFPYLQPVLGKRWHRNRGSDQQMMGTPMIGLA